MQSTKRTQPEGQVDEKGSPNKKSNAVKTQQVDTLRDIAMKLRIHSIKMTEASKSGHPTTCSSIAEIMAVLFFDPAGMHYDPLHPENLLNDRLVLSKGHAAPILCIFLYSRTKKTPLGLKQDS